MNLRNRNIKPLEPYQIAINEVVICESGKSPAKKTKTSKAQYSKLAYHKQQIVRRILYKINS